MPSFLEAVVVLLCFLTIASDFIEHRVRNAWLMVALVLGAGWMIWSWLKNNNAVPWMFAGCAAFLRHALDGGR
jgi:prepilin peptidase CpaA